MAHAYCGKLHVPLVAHEHLFSIYPTETSYTIALIVHLHKQFCCTLVSAHLIVNEVNVLYHNILFIELLETVVCIIV